MLLTIFSTDDLYDFNFFLYMQGNNELTNFVLEDILLTKMSFKHLANAVSIRPIAPGADNSSFPP
jgi:hypothetical protein